MNKLLTIITLLFVVALFAGEDRHFIQDDDYFVNKEGDLGNNTYIYVDIAKMIEPASSSTKGEAKFMTVPDGNEVWSQYYWQSRPIEAEGEIKLGTVIICSEASENSIYIAPRNADESRMNNRWFMAKVVDLSQMYKGIVKVSGGYDVSKENLRVLGKGGFTPVKTSSASQSNKTAVKKSVAVEQPAVVQYNNGNTGSSANAGCGSLKIIKAVYGSLNNQMEVKDYLEEFCKNGQITATATDDFFNSSMDTDEDKNLYIRYQTMAGEFEVQVLQGESVTIPSKSHKRLK